MGPNSRSETSAGRERVRGVYHQRRRIWGVSGADSTLYEPAAPKIDENLQAESVLVVELKVIAVDVARPAMSA